jgi:molybdenum cofactor guanylyltransferase
MIENDIHKIGYLIKNNNTKIIKFPDDNEFININNQDDYNKSKKYISKYNNSEN